MEWIYIYRKKLKGVPRVHAHATQGRIEGAPEQITPKRARTDVSLQSSNGHNDKVFDKQYRGTKVAQAGGFVVSF